MIMIDLEGGVVRVASGGHEEVHALASPEAFSIVSKAWLRAGWDVRYVYGFSWMGRPIIQLPEDLIRIQEVIFALKPDVILETGVAHGGSLIFYASICKATEHGRIIGIDIEIRAHNRAAIEAHPLKPWITLIEGSSTDPATVSTAKALIAPGERCLVILDSNHTKQHVFDELEAYCDFVSVGSYIVACDGIMGLVAGGPRTQPDWSWNNPIEAAKAFAARHPEFAIAPPVAPFNESAVTEAVTYWPGAWLKRLR